MRLATIRFRSREFLRGPTETYCVPVGCLPENGNSLFNLGTKNSASKSPPISGDGALSGAAPPPNKKICCGFCRVSFQLPSCWPARGNSHFLAIRRRRTLGPGAEKSTKGVTQGCPCSGGVLSSPCVHRPIKGPMRGACLKSNNWRHLRLCFRQCLSRAEGQQASQSVKQGRSLRCPFRLPPLPWRLSFLLVCIAM